MTLRQQLTATCLFSILFANAGLAQVTAGNKRLTLRSDFPAKTVMVSSSNQQVGEKSPFLVAATVKENDNQKEFRSLLQFNYDSLPPAILRDPTSITSAQLVLYPINADFLQNNYEEPGKLVVQRIVENWYDSSTAWNNQPMVDSLQVAKQKVRIKRKTPEISINVTLLVMDMILHGNKGFMIRQNNEIVANTLTGLSFASSLNDDKLIRPLLIITYNDGSYHPSDIQQRPTRPVSAPVYTIPTRVPVTVVSNRSE
jgi:hypothetical protein